MKLNCKRIDFTYIPGEEIFNFPEESGLPFIFDVEEELTADPFFSKSNMEHLNSVVNRIENGEAKLSPHDLID